MDESIIETCMQRQSTGEFIERFGCPPGYVFVCEAFAAHPLVGNKLLSEHESALIYSRAREILSKCVTKDLTPTLFDAMVVTLAVVHISKKWISEKKGGFWNFVYEQFKMADSSKLRHVLMDCIDEGLSRNKKLFVFTKRHEYYATVMTHALATEKGVLAYFDFLFEFYKNNLRFVFVNDDVAVSRLISVLKMKLDEENAEITDKLSSYFYKTQICVRTLIKQTPGYAAVCTEEILSKIDAFWSGHSVKKETYLDNLLSQWFSDKLLMIDAQMRVRKDRKAMRLRVAMSFDQIRPTYVLEEKVPAICIPCTRLKQSDAASPTLKITCGAKEKVFALDCFGDRFGKSIDEKTIPLSALAKFESESDMQINVKILLGGETVYDSDKTLCRSAVIFCGGKELSAQNITQGEFQLFTSKNNVVDIEHCDDCAEIGSFGQLLTFSLENGFMIRVNGTILCRDSEQREIQISYKNKPFAGAIYKSNGDAYAIFKDPPEPDVFLPKGHLRKQYSFMLNGAIVDSRCIEEDAATPDHLSLRVDASRLRTHANKFTIYDLKNKKNLHSLLFCAIPNFSLTFDRRYYTKNQIGCGELIADDYCKSFECGKAETEAFAFCDGQIEVTTPRVVWEIDNGTQTEAWEGNVWYETIRQQARIIVKYPRELEVAAYAGNDKIAAVKKHGTAEFDLGNHICGISSTQRNPLSVSLEIKADHPSKTSLFQVVFSACFVTPPRFKLQKNQLRILNPNDYVGPAEIELAYTFVYEPMISVQKYCKPVGSAILSDDCNLQRGMYKVIVSYETTGIFKKERKTVFEGSCFLEGAKPASPNFFVEKKIKASSPKGIPNLKSYFHKKIIFIHAFWRNNTLYNLTDEWRISIVNLRFLFFLRTLDRHGRIGEYPMYRGEAIFVNPSNKLRKSGTIRVLILNKRELYIKYHRKSPFGAPLTYEYRVRPVLERGDSKRTNSKPNNTRRIPQELKGY
ncbi:MAG: hypothetical protein LBP73_07000 [Clostridiales Family XIII bacterium]|jgi:hypothetical protein|nr:hypothetical protein [Clostridiales Family XIII bacterium]